MKKLLPLCLAALVAAGCGSDDGGETTDAETPPAQDLATFESPRIGFTFEYPKRLEAQKRPPGKVLGRVALERRGRLNAIEVRRIARRELPPARYLDDFRRDFERAVEDVEQREERIGDLDMGVLAFETDKLTSASYFFAGAGETWQVACIAEPDHLPAIEAACRTALESVEFVPD